MLHVSAIGTTVGIDLSGLDADGADAVKAAWADAAADPAGEPVAIVVPRPGPRTRMLQSLSQQVTRAAIDARRGDLWMLHAAGIATPEGEVVAFVGPSGRGKTTASRHLGRRYGYVSDETIGIARDGRVVAYRKPLSIIEEARAPKVERAASSIGLGGIPRDLFVRAIVLLHRDASHDGAPAVRRLDLADALDDLVTQSSHLAERPDSLRFIAAIAEATGGIRAVRYREATDLEGIVDELLDGEVAVPVVAPAIVREPAASDGDSSDGDSSDGLRFSRASAVDELELAGSDRIAVLTRDAAGRGVVRVLDGIAPTLWAAASGVSFDALVAAASATHGAPEGVDPAAIVRANVDRLVLEGLLTVSTAAPR